MSAPTQFQGAQNPGALDVRTVSGNRGLQIEEPLIFEQGMKGRSGVDLPAIPQHKDRLGGLKRKSEIGLPGLSEPQVVRHYTKLSQKNYAIDMGVYPLGSCTMKHNPRLNEKVARLPGLGDLHPMQPVSTVQGALELIDQLAHWLKTLTGMPAVAMSPAAGAHGELCGIMAIRAALLAKGDARQAHPGAGIRPRHQSRDRGRLRLRGRSGPGRRSRPRRSRRLQGQARARRRRHHDHQPQHLRPVRERHHRHRRRDARGRRLLLLRRRQLQRHRRAGAAGRSRHRRHAHQSAQDLLDAPWRRRPRLRSGGAVGRARALRAGALCGARRQRLRAGGAAAARRSAGSRASTARWACSSARSPTC